MLHLVSICPCQEAGQTAVRHRLLMEIGREKISPSRLAEAHWDAVAILAEAGRTPEPGALYAVWASEIPNQPLSLDSKRKQSYNHRKENVLQRRWISLIMRWSLLESPIIGSSTSTSKPAVVPCGSTTRTGRRPPFRRYERPRKLLRNACFGERFYRRCRMVSGKDRLLARSLWSRCMLGWRRRRTGRLGLGAKAG